MTRILNIALLLSLLVLQAQAKMNKDGYNAAVFAAVPYFEYDYSLLDADFPALGDLEYSPNLADSVKNILSQHGIKQNTFLQEEATKSNFMNLRDSVNILVMSCHGDEGVLYLAQSDGELVKLTHTDIESKKFANLQLVIITACHSASGNNSIAQSFIKAEAKAVLASNGKTNDYISSVFVPSFLNLYLNGKGVYEALVRTQEYVRTMDDGFWNQPEFWDVLQLTTNETRHN